MRSLVELDKKIDFFYYINNSHLLVKMKALVKSYFEDSEHITYKELSEVDSAISRGVFIVDSSLDFFQEEIPKSQKNILLLFNDILDDFDSYPEEAFISKRHALSSLDAILADFKNTNFESQGFFSIQLKNFILNHQTPCDIFLKISDIKFLKCIKKNDVFDEELKLRFIKKSNSLWVKKEDFYLYRDFLHGKSEL